jgi:hypothetical protein
LSIELSTDLKKSMTSEISKRDQNSIPVLTGITDDANQEIRMLRVNPVTGRLLVSAVGAGVGQVNSVVAGRNISVDSTDPVNPIVTNTNPKITVATTSPSNPQVGDLWVNTA